MKAGLNSILAVGWMIAFAGLVGCEPPHAGSPSEIGATTQRQTPSTLNVGHLHRDQLVRAEVASTEATHLLETLAAAESRYGLPAGLLEVLAFTETGLRPSVPHPEHEKGCGDDEASIGVMGLRPDGHTGATITAAADAVGLSASTLAIVPEANAMGAAALLRQWAGARAAASELGAWWEAVERWSGLPQPHASRYAGQVLGMLVDGARIELIDGTVLRLSEQPSPEVQARRLDTTAASPDYPGAFYTPAHSSNYTAANRTSADINRVVIHTVQGSYAGAISWFANSSANVSAHYVVKSSNGEITQTLLDKHIGWHAGHWNTNTESIGIEHEGFVSDPSWYTDAMYNASAALTKHLCDKYGIPKNRQHIIGHWEVPGCANPKGGGQGCHTDPGDNWNWDKYMALVTGSGTPPPPPPPGTGDLLGYIREGDIFSGPPIAGATVTLQTGASTTAGSNGLYQFKNLSPGTYTVTASAPGYSTKSESKAVEAGIQNWRSIALTPVAAPATGKLLGYVREGDIFSGPAIPGATVVLSNGWQTSSGADGLYTFDAVAVGPYTVTASKAGYITASESKTVEANINNWRSIALNLEAPPPPPPPPPPEDTSGGDPIPPDPDAGGASNDTGGDGGGDAASSADTEGGATDIGGLDSGEADSGAAGGEGGDGSETEVDANSNETDSDSSGVGSDAINPEGGSQDTTIGSPDGASNADGAGSNQGGGGDESDNQGDEGSSDEGGQGETSEASEGGGMPFDPGAGEGGGNWIDASEDGNRPPLGTKASGGCSASEAGHSAPIHGILALAVFALLRRGRSRQHSTSLNQ